MGFYQKGYRLLLGVKERKLNLLSKLLQWGKDHT